MTPVGILTDKVSVVVPLGLGIIYGSTVNPVLCACTIYILDRVSASTTTVKTDSTALFIIILYL